ncbi:ankyrin repeat domain-containing protein SOWAHB-like isoform X1 [Protopterus annectens]|uniref:ankyrin repeat domain-containing protein SOWAHB-like isoform X1 n=1 Tax=Protopterus annectens TaxID=7888 RepID=UPI001CF95D32|nr:ankyrin repeat domain-containing protein SOWAHB-like isoform X1 [Protopterus annectens]
MHHYSLLEFVTWLSQKGGYTPLHIAALHGQEQIIKLLINTYNANPDIRDYHGKKPMHYWKGNSNIFQPHPKEIIPQAPEGRKQNKRSYLPSLIETLAPTVKVDLKWSSCQDQNQPRQ